MITIKWRKNIEPNFLRYRVYGGTSPGPTVKIDSTTGGITDTSMTIAGLSNGIRYYLRLTAVDSAGTESGFSNEVSAVPTDGIAGVQVPLLAGWNMISKPVTSVMDSLSVLYPTSVYPYAYAFDPDTGYIKQETLYNGKGYWERSSVGTIQNIAGALRFIDTVDVSAGWNMIGSISVPVDTASIGSIPGGIVTTRLLWLASSGTYVPVDTIRPGTACWLKASQSGLLILSSTPVSAANRIVIVPTGETPPPPPGDGVSTTAFGADELPARFELSQNYPNPFNPLTTMCYGLPQTSFVTLIVYNTLGQQVAQLVNEQQQAGYHDVVFHGDGLAGGVYFYRLQAGDFAASKKLLLLK